MSHSINQKLNMQCRVNHPQGDTCSLQGAERPGQPFRPTIPKPIGNPPTTNLGRLPGDNRDASTITDNPIFSVFNHLPKYIVDGFQDQVGGNWNDTTLVPEHRADIAANAERVLKYIDNTGGTLSEANNNTIDYADRLDKPRPRLPGVTEAERLGNFANHGYLALNFDTPLPSRRRKG